MGLFAISPKSVDMFAMSVAIDADTALNDPDISDAISPELCTTPVMPAPPPLNDVADKPLSTVNESNYISLLKTYTTLSNISKCRKNSISSTSH